MPGAHGPGMHLKQESIMKKFIIFAIAFLMGIQVVSAQIKPCPPEVVEAARKRVKEYVKNMKVEIVKKNMDSFSSTQCITLKPNSMSAQEFVILGEYLEDNPICSEALSANAECVFIEMLDTQTGEYCNHIYYKAGKQHQYKTAPVPDERQRRSLEQQIEMRKERLRLLKQQQHELNIDNAKLITDALIAEIPSTDVKVLDKLLSDAAEKLQEAGIDRLSDFYGIDDFKPSENETADRVRKILSPIDKILDKCHISSAKFVKYWEALKLTPDVGMVIGNTAAKVHIYFMEKDLKKEMADLEERLEELKKQPSAVKPKDGSYEHRSINMSGSM